MVDGLKACLLRYSELASITGESTTTISSITNIPTWLRENLGMNDEYRMVNLLLQNLKCMQYMVMVK